jgi:hypothetical protein
LIINIKKFNFKSKKALEKEVGDNIDIKSILSGQGNWKGRQQTIRNLQSKLSDLKKQVNYMDARTSQMLLNEEDEFDDDVESVNNRSLFSAGNISLRTTHTTSHRNDLKRYEKEKREQNEVGLK